MVLHTQDEINYDIPTISFAKNNKNDIKQIYLSNKIIS